MQWAACELVTKSLCPMLAGRSAHVPAYRLCPRREPPVTALHHTGSTARGGRLAESVSPALAGASRRSQHERTNERILGDTRHRRQGPSNTGHTPTRHQTPPEPSPKPLQHKILSTCLWIGIDTPRIDTSPRPRQHLLGPTPPRIDTPGSTLLCPVTETKILSVTGFPVTNKILVSVTG